MFQFAARRQNGIIVRIILNLDSNSVIHFASTYPSTFTNFIERLRGIIPDVIDELKSQQLHHITYHVTPSISFGNQYRELPYVVSLNNFNTDEILHQLKIFTHAIDGGYFELKITNPREYVSEQFRFLAQPEYMEVSSDSNYSSDESDS